MNILRKWVLGKMTVDELVTYFAEIDISLDFTFEKKRQPRYYAHNGKLYRINK